MLTSAVSCPYKARPQLGEGDGGTLPVFANVEALHGHQLPAVNLNEGRNVNDPCALALEPHVPHDAVTIVSRTGHGEDRVERDGGWTFHQTGRYCSGGYFLPGCKPATDTFEDLPRAVCECEQTSLPLGDLGRGEKERCLSSGSVVAAGAIREGDR